MPSYFNSLLQIVIALFLLLMTGFIARKAGVIKDDSSAFLSKLLVTVGQPMLIIHSICSVRFSLENLKTGLFIILISVGAHLSMALFAFLFCRGFKNLDEQKIAEFSMIFGNVGFVGFPILDVVLPEIGRFYGAFFLVGFHLTLWSYGVLIFARKRKDIRITPKKLLLNYGTIPCMIGFTLYLLIGLLTYCFPSFMIPPALTTCAEYLSNMSVPVSLMISGSLLATQKPKQIFADPKVYYITLMKLIVIPLLICVIMKLLRFDSSMILFVTTLCATPVAAMVTVVSQLYHVNPGHSSLGVSASTILCVLTIPVVIPIADRIIAL